METIFSCCEVVGKVMVTSSFRQRQMLWRNYILILLFCLGLGLLFRGCVGESYRVTNHALAPDLLAGDIVWVSKFGYGWDIKWFGGWYGWAPKKGEFVVLSCPHLKKVKCLRRVVGIPGDRIGSVGEKEIVPPLHIWVESLEPEAFQDSHQFGVVHMKNLVGRASHIAWSVGRGPGASGEIQVRWKRIFQSINGPNH